MNYLIKLLFSHISERLDKVEMIFQLRCAFFSGSRTVFTGPASVLFSKKTFKIESHGTIHIFKNYFTIMFSVFRTAIQTDP